MARYVCLIKKLLLQTWEIKAKNIRELLTYFTLGEKTIFYYN